MVENESTRLERAARYDPASMARKLAREHSAMQAFRLTAREIMAARRARNRKTYQFWTGVADELEARFVRSIQARAPDAPPATVADAKRHAFAS